MRRARFLQTSGAIVVAFSLPVMHACAPTDPYPDVDSWLAIDGNGDVTVSWGKVELGTGIDTAITQLVADELYVPFARVRLAGV
jgi:nicotinate dehydrogenase subunit B